MTEFTNFVAQCDNYSGSVGTMNIMVRIGDEVITPPLAGTILDGVTRNSTLQLMRDWGLKVSERQITIRRRCEFLAWHALHRLEYGEVQHLPRTNLLLDHLAASGSDVDHARTSNHWRSGRVIMVNPAGPRDTFRYADTTLGIKNKYTGDSVPGVSRQPVTWPVRTTTC